MRSGTFDAGILFVHWHGLVLALLVAMLTACGGNSGNQGVTPLMKAAHDGDAPTVASLIADGVNVDETSDYGWTPLMFAAREGHEAVVVSLLEAGADANRVSQDVPPAAFATRGGVYPTTALAEAIKEQHDEIALRLLDVLTTIHPIDMVAAAQRSERAWLERLIDRGADPSARSRLTFQDSPLNAAAAAGHTATVDWLVSTHGVDVNQRPGSSDALEQAVRNDHPETVERLLRLGANPNATYEDSTMPTALLLAIKQPVGDSRLDRNLLIVEALVRHGADPLLEPDYSVFGLGLVGEDRNALTVAAAKVEEYREYAETEADTRWQDIKRKRLQHREAILAVLQRATEAP